MASEETAYKYVIPLEEQNGVERPAYSTSAEGESLVSLIRPESKVVVNTEPIPHLHKDSVNVQVSEVPLENYVDEADNGGEN
jgi:hypothetical protein